jgi:hypothetical protein
VAVYRHTPFGNITFSPYKRKLSVDKNKNKEIRKKNRDPTLCSLWHSSSSA